MFVPRVHIVNGKTDVVRLQAAATISSFFVCTGDDYVARGTD